MNNIRLPPYFSFFGKYTRKNMNYKIYDYAKNDFKRQLDDRGNLKYYIRVNKKFIEVTR